MRGPSRAAEFIAPAKSTRGSQAHLPVVSVVACPTCGAAIGFKCVKKDGTACTRHPRRARMATRFWNETRGITRPTAGG